MHFPTVFTAEVIRVTLRCNVVDVFMTAPSKTHSFEIISHKLPFKYGIKKYGFVRDVPEKVGKKRQAIALAARGGCGGLGQPLAAFRRSK